MKPPIPFRNFLFGSALIAAVSTATHAAPLIWDGGGSPSVNWNLGTNWDTDATPISSSDITFNNTVTGPLSTTMGAAYTVNSLNFTSAQTSSVIINTDNTKALTIGGGATTDISVQAGSHTFIGTNGGSNTAGDLFFTNGTTNVINIADTASLTIQARIRNVSGNTVTMQKTGLGTLVLSGNNGGTGGWVLSNAFAIQAGVLRFATASAYGNSANQYTVSSGAALELSGGGNQSNASGTITLNGTGIGGAGALRSLSGTNGITSGGSIVLNTVGDNSIGVDADTLSIANVISGTSSSRNLTKVGVGTLSLVGVNTYTGATNVVAGKLTISSTGTINSTSSISIGAAEFNYNSSTALSQGVSFSGTGGTLSGNSSTISSAVNVTTGNTLAIGNSNVGAMNFGNNLEIAGTYLFELNNTTDTADLGNVTGILTLSGTLDLVQLGTYSTGDKFTLLAYSSTLSGTFAGLADGAQFTDADGLWQIDYNDTISGSNGGTGTAFVTVTAIPEPGAAFLGSLGLLALLRRRR